MTRLRSLLLVGGFALFGCASNQGEAGAPLSNDVESSSPSAEEPGAATPTQAAGNAPLTSQDQPVYACGPGASYELVAFTKCEDGTMPLEGDAEQGARARLGSLPPHQEGKGPMDSHMVDHYQVPCPEGSVDIYVCMYHCPE